MMMMHRLVRVDARATFDSDWGRFDDVRHIRTVFIPLTPQDNNVENAKLGTASFLHVLDFRGHRQLGQALQILTGNWAIALFVSPNLVGFGNQGVRNVFPPLLCANIGHFTASVLSEVSVRGLARRDNDPGFLDQTADTAAGETHNVLGHGERFAGEAPRDVMRPAERAVEVNVDLDVVQLRFPSHGVCGADERQGGKEDGETEGVGDQRWVVLGIWLDAGW